MGNGLAVLGGEEEAEFDPMNIVSVDWNVALRKGNQLYDRLAAACRMSDYAARRQSLATIEFEVEQMGNQLHELTAWVGGVLSLRKRSDVLAGAVISLTLGAIQACGDAEDRANTMSDLIRLAAALAVYRAVHGQYPETLDALVPDALSELPVDRFHAKPFVYRRDGAGYLLYSTGENGTDDGGGSQLLNTFEGRNVSDYDESKQQEIEASIPDGSDDNSIRVPRPAFKLPSPPGNE